MVLDANGGGTMIQATSTTVAALVLVLLGPRRHIGIRRPPVPAAPPRPAPQCRSRLRARRGQAGAVVAVVAIVVIVHPLPAMVVGGGALLIRPARRMLHDRRRQRAIEEALPGAIELLVHTINAGLTPIQAMTELSASAPLPVRHGFQAVVERVEHGVPFADALRELPRALGSGTHPVADVLASADRYGVSVAAALQSLSLEARAARRRHSEAAARRLPVQLAFPLVVCTLPSFVLVAIAPAAIAALSSLRF
jgi:tight adherence protein C